MSKWIDFREIRKALEFSEVLRHYKVELKLKGDQHHGFCPLPSHNGKRNSPSFSANVKKGVWQCFGCGQMGNVLDFAVLMESGDPQNGENLRRVALGLKERFLKTGTPAKPPEVPAKDESANAIVNAPLDFALKGLDPAHPYLGQRGFDPETIEEFGLGFCRRGLLKDRMAIPLHNNARALIGYAGRVVDDAEISEENPKYRFPGTRKRKGEIYEFRKSAFLYNAHRIAAPVDYLAVVEGFTSVWWLWQAGIPNVGATMGASCSKEQADTVVSLVAPQGRVFVFTDGDEAGVRCAQSILCQVSPYRFVRWIKLESNRQPTNLSPVELEECVSL